MGTYAVTGSASGMGRQASEKLRAAGHTVIGVDLRDAEVLADLSTAQGRRAAADEVLTATGGDWTVRYWPPEWVRCPVRTPRG